jgi:hypothetical protein
MRLLLVLVLAAALADDQRATVLTGPDGRFDVVLQSSRP